MKPTTMSDIVILLQISDGQGHYSDNEILQSRIVWASVKDTSTSTK